MTGSSASMSSDDDEAKSTKRYRCNEQLEEYWEVDGKMFCERHGRRVEEGHLRARDSSAISEDNHGNRMGIDADLDDRDSVRALKRTTRFIDLR